MFAHQDLKPIVFRKEEKKKLTNSQINRAILKKDPNIVTLKRSTTVKALQKLDADTNDFRQPSISHSFNIALQQARTSKKLTQDQLAKMIN
jgi:putative transcription factor